MPTSDDALKEIKMAIDEMRRDMSQKFELMQTEMDKKLTVTSDEIRNEIRNMSQQIALTTDRPTWTETSLNV